MCGTDLSTPQDLCGAASSGGQNTSAAREHCSTAAECRGPAEPAELTDTADTVVVRRHVDVTGVEVFGDGTWRAVRRKNVGDAVAGRSVWRTGSGGLA